MPRVIFKCPYLKSGDTTHKGNLVSYIATRDGVQKMAIHNKTLPVTKKQEKLISQILNEFPDAKNLFEYEDYLKNKTLENASEFITIALEHNLDVVAKKENYVDYIANRPRVEKIASHGLFNGGSDELVLSKVAKEVSGHEGNVWLPIIALRREDAISTGFDNAERWKEYLSSYAPTIAESLKIPLDEFRWYAAFHNESHHPHIHMICYCENARHGFLDKKGIAKIKSGLVSGIFKQEMTAIYAEQTKRRDELKTESKKVLEQLIVKISTGEVQMAGLEKMLVELSENLKCTQGKRVYGYLPPRTKALVDSITDELAKEPTIAHAYKLWSKMRSEITASYRDTPEPILPLSQQKEFKSIKNHIIYEADKLCKGEISLNELDDVEQPEQEPIAEDENTADIFAEPIDSNEEIPIEEHSSPYVKWTDDYNQARVFLFGDADHEPDFEQALELLQAESQNGNMLAVFDLGRMYADGLGVEQNYEKAFELYLRSAKQGFPYADFEVAKMFRDAIGTEKDEKQSKNHFEQAYVGFVALEKQSHDDKIQYRLGWMLQNGIGTEKDIPKAKEYFEKSTKLGNPFACYSLAKLILAEDNLITEELQTALKYLQIASNSGNEFAQYSLAKLYLQGEQIPKDTHKAVSYLTASAEQGNQFAQYILGKLYLMGKDVPKDKETAIKWFTLSAEQGNEYAQFFLNNMDKWKEPSVSFAVTRLMHHMSRIFENNQPPQKPSISLQIDSKRMRKLRGKKMAQGHKKDDHEQRLEY